MLLFNLFIGLAVGVLLGARKLAKHSPRRRKPTQDSFAIMAPGLLFGLTASVIVTMLVPSYTLPGLIMVYAMRRQLLQQF
jgi:hypothetical protein